MQSLEQATWPQAQLGEAILALARASGLAPQAVEAASAAALQTDDDERIGDWIDHAARHLGLDAEAAAIPYGQLDLFLAQGGPAIVRLPAPHAPRFLALLGGRGAVRVIVPGGAVQSIPWEAARAALAGALEAPRHDMIESVLDAAGAPMRRRVKARRAMLRSALAQASIPGCWRLQLPAGAPARLLAGQARLPQRLTALLGVHTAQYCLWLLAWWLIGRATLAGRLDGGVLLTWGLLLCTLIPCRLLGTWLQGLIAVSAGGLLKERLLSGLSNKFFDILIMTIQLGSRLGLGKLPIHGGALDITAFGPSFNFISKRFGICNTAI